MNLEKLVQRRFTSSHSLHSANDSAESIAESDLEDATKSAGFTTVYEKSMRL